MNQHRDHAVHLDPRASAHAIGIGFASVQGAMLLAAALLAAHLYVIGQETAKVAQARTFLERLVAQTSLGEATPPKSESLVDPQATLGSAVQVMLSGGALALSPSETIDIRPLDCPGCQNLLREALTEIDRYSSILSTRSAEPQGLESDRVELLDSHARLRTLLSSLTAKLSTTNPNVAYPSLVALVLASALNIVLYLMARRLASTQLEVLEASQEELALLEVAGRSSIIYCDHSYCVTWANQAYLTATGMVLSDVLGKPLYQALCGPAGPKRSTPSMIEAALHSGEEIKGFHLNCFRKDGSDFWTSVDVQPTRGDAAKQAGYVALQTDVSVEIELARQIVERESFQSALIHSAHNAIFVVNELGGIELLNPAAERMFGYTAHHLLGKQIDILLPEALRGPKHAEYIKVFSRQPHSSRPMSERAVSGVRSDGSEVQLLVSLSKLRFRGQTRFVAILMDVTAERNLASSMQRAEVAKLANDAKTQFLIKLGHEIRSPMGAISGFTHLLSERLKGSDDAVSKRYLDLLALASQQLTSLAQDVLDLELVESGGIQLSIADVPIAQVLEDCAKLHAPVAAAAGVGVHVVPTDQIALVIADRRRVIQVINNLLANAIKYNTRGGMVFVRLAKHANDAVFSISDSGQGMSEDQMAHLFEPFNRLGAEATRVEGSGVGLALVKQLVEAMGGSIRVESCVGRGTTFHVALRLSKVTLDTSV